MIIDDGGDFGKVDDDDDDDDAIDDGNDDDDDDVLGAVRKPTLPTHRSWTTPS